MDRKRVVILGAGISGLSVAWALRQTREPLDIVIVERGTRLGGYFHTDYTTGFHFEKGPRLFKVEQCPDLMQLVAALGLQKELILSKAQSHHRYLWHQEELLRFPTNPISFLLSPLTKGLIRAILTEWRQPAKETDETVWEFALRRFNYDVARLLFDPLVVGVFGSDIRKISVRACFPVLKAWEENLGSITKGLWQRFKERRCSPCSEAVPCVPLSATLSFRGGMEVVTQTLASKVGARLMYQHEVKELSFEGSDVRVETDRGSFVADLLFCALPAKETGLLFQPHQPLLSQELLDIYSQGIAVVSLGYEVNVLPVEGFGYLTSTYANEDILSVVFDSFVFPEQNRMRGETRLAVKIEDKGRSEDECVSIVLKGIRRHLGISRTPAAIHVKQMPRAVPQYRVGHLDKMRELDAAFQERFPRCYLLGNYLEGVSVNCCVARAKKIAQRALSSL